jgi:hypothetical protein
MLECACHAASPKKHDCLLVTVGEDYVEAEPLNPELRCTPLSVAVQALHETSSPVIRREPGGIVDTTACTIEAVTDRVVRIEGMRWEPRPYTIKLEGARSVGFSAITFAATRDPGLIGQFETFLAFVRESTKTKPIAAAAPNELAIVAEVVGTTQEIANAALALARVTLLHSDFAGRMCREGNMAFPFSPSDIERGEIFEFMLNHVVMPDDPLEMFHIEYEEV